MRVVTDGYFDIRVNYMETINRHHLPHCHIKSPDGDTVVNLLTLEIIVGKSLSKRARIFLLDNYDAVCEAWNKYNPNARI